MSFSLTPSQRKAALAGAVVAGVGLSAYLIYRQNSKKTPEPSAPVEEEPNFEALKAKGNEHFKRERFEEAIEVYTKALELNPSEAHVIYSNRAVSFVKLGRFQEALSDAEMTIAANPEFSRGFERKGQALIGLERYEEAFVALQEATRLQPSKQENAQFMELVRLAMTGIQKGMMKKNIAFVFVKPHALTEATVQLVKDSLEAQGIQILIEGVLTGEEIDSKKLIDQHYYAIASKATILKPDQLNVPNDKFQKAFGLSWTEALATGRVFNAQDACVHLGVSADELDELWAKTKANNKLAKLGGGFYCGLVEVEGKDPVYVFNGFFMTMRSKYTAPGSGIHFFVVAWEPSALSWSDFRSKVLGPTDPATAPKSSLRGMILSQWKTLGLQSEPNTGDNGVHASASPFEALAERMNWLSVPATEDPFGASLLAAGISEDTIVEWARDATVKTPEGTQGSLFDQLEDLDTSTCLEKCVQLASLQ